MSDRETMTKYYKSMDLLKHGRSHGNRYDAYINHHKRVKNILEAYHTRSALVEFRKNVLDHQKKLNYQLEYDRIRNELHKAVIPHTTRTLLQDRERELLNLGATALPSGIH